jgi:hypothetical protein
MYRWRDAPTEGDAREVTLVKINGSPDFEYPWRILRVECIRKLEVNNVKGVWVVWYHDELYKGVLVVAFPEEIDALRYVNNNTGKYMEIRASFLPYGTEFSELVKANG